MHKQDWIGITAIIPEGVAPMPVYKDAQGIQTFVVDDPYILMDGITDNDPISVVVVKGPVCSDEMGNAIQAVPVRVIPSDNPTPVDQATWDSGQLWDNQTPWKQS